MSAMSGTGDPVTPDALPYLPSRAAWHRAVTWCRAQAPFLAAYWASRYWHATRNRKDQP